jgi:hypothetical protein
MTRGVVLDAEYLQRRARVLDFTARMHALKGQLGQGEAAGIFADAVAKIAETGVEVLPDGVPREWYRAKRRTPYEVLRERYVVGFYTLADFERFVVRLIECGDA